MLALRLAVLIVLLTAPAAQAAPLAEQAFEPLPNRAVATCLRATGTPSGLAIFGPISARSSSTDLLAAGPAGTTRTARVDLGSLVDCAAVATAPGGAAVVAGAVQSRARVEVRAVVQDPGGAFAAPVTLGDTTDDGPEVAAAVSPSGHAVVAWVQTRGAPRSGDPPFRIVAARRAPGGGFGAFQRLTPWRRGLAFAGVHVTAGIDAGGVATVAWARPSATRGRALSGELTVETASAAPGAAFVLQRLANRVLEATEVALAVAPDGWAVVAHAGSGGTRAFERAPGATRFSTAFRAELAEDRAPTVAIRDGGGAVVAWRHGSELDVAGVEATARPAAGTFPDARTVAAPGNDDPNFGLSTAELSVVGPFPADEGNWTLRSALAPDGRALLAWGGSRAAAAGGALIPHVAAGTLAGAFGPPQALGSPVRDVNGVAPVFLPDGRAGLAWTDNVAFEAFGLRLPSGTGRLHLAVEAAAAAPEPALPRLRVRAHRTQRLFDGQRLKVRATCDRACDLRAVLHDGSFDRGSITRTLLGAGTARFAFPSADPDLRARRRSRVVVQATGPGGHALTGARVRVKVIRRQPLPVPPPLGVKARRRGSAIVISWHTASPARRAIYIVAAWRSRDQAGGFDRTRFGSTHGRARTRFTVRLHPRRPGLLHWVTVQGDSIDEGRPTRAVGASVPPV